MKLPVSRKVAVLSSGFMLLVAALFILPRMIPSLAPKLSRFSDRVLNADSLLRKTVRGQVTYFDPERGLLFVQNESEAWRIETSELHPLKLGQFIEATGMLSLGSGPLCLQSAALRPLGDGTRPSPLRVTPEQLSGTTLANKFVVLGGAVSRGAFGHFGQISLSLKSGGRVIDVRITDYTGPSPAGLEGASTRAEGVLNLVPDAEGRFSRLNLLLNSSADLHVDSVPRSLTQAPQSRETQNRNLPVLTRVADLHQLTFEQAERQYPLSLTGVVTFADTASFQFFIQDESGGVFVDAANVSLSGLRAGQKVALTGVSGPGLFAPIVTSPRIHIISENEPLPGASKPGMSRLLSGVEDSNWVEVEAVIRSVRLDRRHVAVLDAEHNGTRFPVMVSGVTSLPRHLIDASVRIQGVCGTEFNRFRQLMGFHILTPSMDFVQVATPQPPAGELPLRPISELGAFSAENRYGHRQRVQGKITFRSPQGLVYIQDRTGALQIQSESSSNDLKVGDWVEALGFPKASFLGIRMVSAELQRIRPGSPPQPRRVSADQIVNEGAEGQWIELDATLIQQYPSEGGEVFLMHSGNSVFTAQFPNQNGLVARKGSLLRLHGICVLRYRPTSPSVPSGFSLLIPSPLSIQVLREAPWWTARSILWILGLVAFSSILISVWAFVLRRQVRRQTSVISTQLEEAQKLKTEAESAARVKSAFLANMSHEIRTPLNGVLGMTQLAMTEDITPTVRDYLETAEASGLSLLQIINDVLDLSKIEAGRMSLESVAFNLEDTVTMAAAILRPQAASKNINLEIHYPMAAPRWFSGDPLRIRQIILNLLSNAVKFTAKGGATVEVTCRPAPDEAALVRVTVVDTGIGIPLEQQSRLFQSFTQADASTTRKYGGTGLGLAISKQIALMMNGSIGFESQAGQGSTFWFEIHLPLCDASVSSETVSAANCLQPFAPVHLAGAFAPGRILLAEDNLVNQKVASRLLEKMGFEVDIAGDGVQAADSVKTTEYCAILMDCQMPLCDGYEATERIRLWEQNEGRPRTPIIALTAHALAGDRERCQASGMDEYLTKPLRIDDLRAALEQWIGRATA